MSKRQRTKEDWQTARLRRELDRTFFLPALDKHHPGGIHSTLLFDIDDIPRTAEQISDDLEDGLLAIGDDDMDDEP